MLRKNLTAKEKIQFIKEFEDRCGDINSMQMETAWAGKAISTKSYYRWKHAFEIGGKTALESRKKNIGNMKNRIRKEWEDEIVKMTIDNPEYSRKTIWKESKKSAINISESGIQKIWERFDLERICKRIDAKVAKIVQGDIELNSEEFEKLIYLKNKKKNNDSVGILFPLQYVLHDIIYVGLFENIGKVYLNIIIDLYSKSIFAIFKEKRNDMTALMLLNGLVANIRGEHAELKKANLIHNIITGNKPELNGAIYEHRLRELSIRHLGGKEYQFLLENICDETFNEIKNDFIIKVIRCKKYNSIREINFDFKKWVEEYFSNKPYYGQFCYGKSRLQTYLDAIHMAYEERIMTKNIAMPENVYYKMLKRVLKMHSRSRPEGQSDQ